MVPKMHYLLIFLNLDKEDLWTLAAVIPAKAGIQENTGCRIKSGMTKLAHLIAGLITRNHGS